MDSDGFENDDEEEDGGEGGGSGGELSGSVNEQSNPRWSDGVRYGTTLTSSSISARAPARDASMMSSHPMSDISTGEISLSMFIYTRSYLAL